MIEERRLALEERVVPQQVDVFEILDDGQVVCSDRQKVDILIGDADMACLHDPEVMRHIRDTYGAYLGVMRDTPCSIRMYEHKTPKKLLGFIVQKT